MYIKKYKFIENHEVIKSWYTFCNQEFWWTVYFECKLCYNFTINGLQ